MCCTGTSRHADHAWVPILYRVLCFGRTEVRVLLHTDLWRRCTMLVGLVPAVRAAVLGYYKLYHLDHVPHALIAAAYFDRPAGQTLLQEIISYRRRHVNTVLLASAHTYDADQAAPVIFVTGGELNFRPPSLWQDFAGRRGRPLQVWHTIFGCVLES